MDSEIMPPGNESDFLKFLEAGTCGALLGAFATFLAAGSLFALSSLTEADGNTDNSTKLTTSSGDSDSEDVTIS